MGRHSFSCGETSGKKNFCPLNTDPWICGMHEIYEKHKILVIKIGGKQLLRKYGGGDGWMDAFLTM